MPNCINYNCDDLGTHVPSDCNEVKLGGISAIIILHCDHQLTDPSDGTEVNAELTAGRATLIENIKSGLNARTPVEVESYVSGRPSRVVTYDNELTIVDANMTDNNRSFYDDAFNGQSFGGLILYEQDANQVTWMDASVSAQGSRIIPVDNNEAERFEGVFKWRTLSLGSIHSVPSGVFS